MTTDKKKIKNNTVFNDRYIIYKHLCKHMYNVYVQ